MTAATTATRSRPTLEELVDRLIDTIFGLNSAVPARTSPTRAIHEVRRLIREGELDRGLDQFAELDLAGALEGETRWAYAEFLDLVRRRFGSQDAWLYCAGNGRAAVLMPLDKQTLEVCAVLGMRWRPGRVVSRRSLRGLRPLAKGCAT